MKTMEGAVLLPCPFCGGAAGLFWNFGARYAQCFGCGVQGGAGVGHDDAERDEAAIAKWNSRSTPQPPPEAGSVGDANVEAIRAKLLERSIRGIAKYGITTERSDLSRDDWLRHLQEELLDAAVYVEAALKACPYGVPDWAIAMAFREQRDPNRAIGEQWWLSAIERRARELVAATAPKESP